MRITSVSLRRLKTIGNFNNIAIEATASVEEGDTPEAVRDQLDLWVQGQIEDRKSVSQMCERLEEIRWQTDSLSREKGRLEIEVEELRKAVQRLRKTPLESLAEAPDETPF